MERESGSELEMSKLRVARLSSVKLDDVQVQILNAVCIGFYRDDNACFPRKKFPQNAGDANLISNIEPMIHSPNLCNPRPHRFLERPKR
jgi:hypothetical protein